MNKNEFEKGTKRKCASCGTLFYDFNQNPLICPSCGAEVNILTNISKRGRPPKVAKTENVVGLKEKDELEIEDLNVEDEVIVPNDDINDSIGDDSEEVENIIEIDKEEES